LSRWRHYDPKTKLRSGWYGRGKMTRKAYAEALGVNVVVVKAWDRGAKPRAGSLAKICALQKLVSADHQMEILDHKAEIAAARAEAKLAATRAKALDAMLDAAMKAARRPMKKSAKQSGLF